MRDLRPWTVQRIGPYTYRVGPWKPWTSRPVRAGFALLIAAGALTELWRLQAEASLAIHKTITTGAALLMLWAWRSFRRPRYRRRRR